MLTMESGEWSIQCPVRTEDSSIVVLAFGVFGTGIEEFSNTRQTVQDPGRSFPFLSLNSYQSVAYKH
jgi:hypothetical protein